MTLTRKIALAGAGLALVATLGSATTASAQERVRTR